MKAGSMEGLIGASVNMKLTKTPMRVYKEAERRGDTAVMERAMGYVTEFQEKAHKYSDKAQEELVKELKEERKEQELKREQAIEKRKEKTLVKEVVSKTVEQSVNLSISDEGRNALREMVSKFESASDDIDVREMTIKNTNEVAWEE